MLHSFTIPLMLLFNKSGREAEGFTAVTVESNGRQSARGSGSDIEKGLPL